MVRHKQFRGGSGEGSAAKYYTEHLALSQYYAKGVGLLHGKAFEHMGAMQREIDLEAFMAIEKNLHPVTGEKLTPRTNTVRKEWEFNKKTGQKELVEKDNRLTGMDLPFIVPKTLSEVIAENPGELRDAIMKKVVRAADKGMEFAESMAKAQVCKGGAKDNRVTGNLLYLRVIHDDARPVGSNVPDPMIHPHHYIFNLTHDPVENRLKAVNLYDVVKHADIIDAVFLSDLEKGLTELGIGTERTPDGRSFEITGVKGKEIFSKRRNEIFKHEIANSERIETLTRYRISAAAKIGKALDYEKVKTEIRNELGKQLAQGKKALSLEEKLAELRAQMTPEIRASLQQDAVMNGERRNWRTPEQAREEVLHSAFKQRSVVHELTVAGELLRATGGSLRLEDALAYVRSSAFIQLDKEGHVTTQRVKDEEVRMRTVVREGWDEHWPLAPDHVIRDPLVASAPDQAASVQFILNSADRVMDVSGVAGAGKSTMLKELVPPIRKTGKKVVLLAPTSASEENLRKDFPEAITLQKFETDLEMQREIRPGTVIMLDEVSMVSVPQLARLVKFAEEKQCRLVTLGDSDQHHSVERGDAIRILQDSGSVRSVQLTETYRAKVQYLKETVLDLKAGGERREHAFNRLDTHGDIREVQDLAELRQKAVETHLEAVRSGHTAILASPVHAEARAAAAIVRETLKAEGLIEKEDHTVTRLSRLNLEGIELRDPLHYQEGRVVSFHTKVAGGFKAGQKWRVLNSNTLERDGVTRTFNPGSKGKWNVYETQEMEVSVGDQVRITEGFRERGVAFKNNDIGKVAAIHSDRITLDDGRSMKRDFVHLDQGVCITSHASECRTVRQIVGLVPLSSFAQIDEKSFYVLTSRASHKAIFYTDSKEALKDAVLRPGDRQSVWQYEKEIEKIPERIYPVDLKAVKTFQEFEERELPQKRDQSRGRGRGMGR